MTRIAHLLDDLGPGGVTRYVDFLISAAAGGEVHEKIHLSRSRWSAPRIDADVIVSHLTISWRSLPMILSLRASHPTAMLIHVEHSYCEGFCRENRTPMRRFSALLRTGYAMFDHLVAVSNAQGDWIRAQEFARDSKVRVIEPCVGLDDLLQLPSKPLCAPRRFALIGRMTRMKGFDLAIAGFRAAAPPDARLDLYGDGPDRKALMQQADGDRRIFFHEWAAPEEALMATDVVLMPSRWEPFGLVALETLAAGRALISSRAEGLRSRSPDIASFVEENTAADWASAIAEAVEQDFTLKASRGRMHAMEQMEICLSSWRKLWKVAPEERRAA